MRYVYLDSFGRKEDPFFFACETVLLEDLKEDLFFIWRVYDAVIIGKHQLLETEVNQIYTKENDIKIFRRLSGGGAVFSDAGCIKYSFLTKNANKEDVFKESLLKIKHVFDGLNIKTEISGRNDILYEGKKFSGNAYYKNLNGSCLHGTILYDTCFDKLVKSITPSNDKLISKGITSVKSRVVNMKNSIGLDIEDFTSLMIKDICNSRYDLTKEQLDRVAYYQNLYEQPNYVYLNNPPYRYDYNKRFDCGTVGVKIDVKRNLIKDVMFYGDYFANEPTNDLVKLLLNQPFNNLDIEAIFKDINIKDYIIGLDNDSFYELFRGGMN